MENGRYKLLIVDDDQQVRELLKLTLERAEDFECSVTVVPDAMSALDILEVDSDYDLIISDHRMSEMTGVELLSKVRQRYPDIKRVLITAYSELDLARAAINEAMVHNYIEKPWNQKELRATILHLLRSGSEENSEDIRLEEGNAYLLEEQKPNETFKISLERMKDIGEGLLITRLHRNKLKQKYDFDEEKIDYRWLTKMSGRGNIDPVDLELTADLIIRYYEQGGKTVLIEGVDALLRDNSFKRFVGFMDNLVDVVGMSEGVLVMNLDPRIVSEKELAVMERKMNTFKL